jgi:ABC-type sulfate transport system permease component
MNMAYVLSWERVMGNFVSCLTINGSQQHQPEKVKIILHNRWRNNGNIRGVRVVILMYIFWVNVG